MSDALQAAIRIRDLRVRRGGHLVLPAVSLELPAQRVIGLLGPSGSGKTTLIRSIVGVQIVEAGSVDVLGLPAGSPPLRARVAYVTQAPSVYGDLTVRENLRYFARVVDAAPGRVEEAIETVGLAEQADLSSRRPVRRPALARLTGDRPARTHGAARARRADGRPRSGAAP